MFRIFSFILLCIFSGTALATASLYPQLNFEYGIAYDKLACDSTKPMTEAMENELASTIPLFAKRWAIESPILLQQLLTKFNKPFEYGHKELTVDFLLCGNVSSMSLPLLINARMWLKSADPDPIGYAYFVPAMFHELLHRYLWQNYKNLFDNSRLLKKYEAEGEVVKFHLHLYAVMEYIYLSLGKEKELQQIMKEEARFTDPAYTRTWQIINNEGYQPFIDEILNSGENGENN